MRRLLVTLALSVPLLAHADYDAAHAAERAKDYERAFALYEEAARADDARAQAAVGRFLLGSRGHAVDERTARAWFGRAARGGDTAGQFFYGAMLVDGVGGERDLANGVRWLDKSAKAGDASAQSMLGHLHRIGTGVPKDIPLALSWFEKAAAQGDDDAVLGIAGIHFIGDGVKRDMAEARRRLQPLVAKGSEPAIVMLAAIEPAWQQDQPTPDYTEALRLANLAAKTGNANSQFGLGTLHLLGRGTAQNPAVAFEWFERSASQGHVGARCYLDVMGDERDRARGMAADVARNVKRITSALSDECAEWGTYAKVNIDIDVRVD